MGRSLPIYDRYLGRAAGQDAGGARIVGDLDLPTECVKSAIAVEAQGARMIQGAGMHPEPAIGRDQARSSARFMSQRPAPFPIRPGVAESSARIPRLAEVELEQPFIAAPMLERIERDRWVADDGRVVIGQRQTRNHNQSCPTRR